MSPVPHPPVFPDPHPCPASIHGRLLIHVSLALWCLGRQSPSILANPAVPWLIMLRFDPNCGCDGQEGIRGADHDKGKQWGSWESETSSSKNVCLGRGLHRKPREFIGIWRGSVQVLKCIYPEIPMPVLRLPLLPHQGPDFGLCWESNPLSTSAVLTIKSSSCRRWGSL